jgi:AcrR family transcriptional regulator
MSKGQQTKAAILESAVELASQTGLLGLTIGKLAARTGMSKSGLFAHFGSKEDLQIAVLQATRKMFADVVFLPALREPPGLPRLRAMVANFIDWPIRANLPGGCVMVAAAYEYDDQPGVLKDLIAQTLRELRKTIARAVRQSVAQGHLRADTDADQFAFEIFGCYVAAQLDARLFGDPQAWTRAHDAFESLVMQHGGVSSPRGIPTALPIFIAQVGAPH